jgi:hypothetical protein
MKLSIPARRENERRAILKKLLDRNLILQRKLIESLAEDEPNDGGKRRA